MTRRVPQTRQDEAAHTLRVRVDSLAFGVDSVHLLVTSMLLVVASLSVSPARATAESQSASAGDARAILERAYYNLYADDYVQVMRIVTSMRGGQEMSRTLQITRRQSIRPGKALLRFTKPKKVRGTSLLILEEAGRSDELFIYLPSLKKSKRLSAAQRADLFFGTDLSYEDVEPKHVEDYEIEDLGEDAFEGRPCRLIEQRARPPYESTYKKIVSCIEAERGVILWTDFYRGDKARKRLQVDPTSVRAVEGRFIPHLITVTTPSRRSQTRIVIESYQLRSDIPDSLFSTWNLEAGSARRDRNRAGEAGVMDVLE